MKNVLQRRLLLTLTTMLMTGTASFILLNSGHAKAQYVSAGGDSIDAIVFNADSDGNGPGLFAVVVGTDYDGYAFIDGVDPGASAQLRVEDDQVILNVPTLVSGSNGLTVGGTTVTNGVLDLNGGITGEGFSVADGTGDTTIDGKTTTNGLLDVNGGITAENFLVADDTGNTTIGGITVTNGLLDVNGGIEGENFKVANDTGVTEIYAGFYVDTNGATDGGTTLSAAAAQLTMSSDQVTIKGDTGVDPVSPDRRRLGLGTEAQELAW